MVSNELVDFTHRAYKKNTNGVASQPNRVQIMSPDRIRECLQRLKKNLTDQVTGQIDDLVSDAVAEIENTDTMNGDDKKYDQRKSEKNGGLLEKKFEIRNSLLTDLFHEVKHVKTIFNIFIAMLIILLLNTIACDLLDTGTVNMGLNTIMAGFGKFGLVFQIWSVMTISSFSVYVAFSYWAHQRAKFQPKSFFVKLWDYSWLTLFIMYQVSFVIIPAKAILSAHFPPPSATLILMEQIRMLMKIHAFVRSAAPEILRYKPHTDKTESPIPEFSHFSYFMFAPTIVYRKSYPRLKEIRWHFVAWYFFEVALVILYVAFTFERLVFPMYHDFGRQPTDSGSIILKLFGTTLPGIMLFCSGFYCLLHAWHNACAELLRFGDKMFYKDWWNSRSYDVFYRTWNIVVYDWLYTYIYKDIYDIMGNKIIAGFSVFFISAIVHEYILVLSLRFFYPIMLLIFGLVGFPLVFITKSIRHNAGNIFLWFSLITGSGTMVSLYSMEYFARINCPAMENTTIDWFHPKSLSCHT